MHALTWAPTEVLMHTIQLVSPDALKPNPRNARTHSKKQIRQIADSIGAFGFTVSVPARTRRKIVSIASNRICGAET